MSYKEIDIRKAVDAVAEGLTVYVLHKLEKDATVMYLHDSEGFLIKTEPVQNRVEPKLQEKQIWPPKKEPAKIDHNKICALYKAKWTIAKIADEMGCSQQTVINHLKKEGLRK